MAAGSRPVVHAAGGADARRSLGVLAAVVFFAAAVGLVATGPLRAGPSGDSSGAASVDSAYGELPLSFMRDGSTFTASTSSGTISLRADGATIVPLDGRHAGAPIEMGLIGAAATEPQAISKLPGVVNDLRGDDSSKWRTNVPTYAAVRYADVYPGIAMDYHGTTGTLEYDFRLDAGADPSRIAVDFHGAPLHVTGAGALVIGAGQDRIRQAPPVAFQPVADDRDPVAARFAVDGDRVGFELGAYDRTRPLVIDPLFLSYATFLGGSDDDGLGDIAVDASGAAYVAGYTISSNFPTTSGVYDTTPNGSTDVMVTKLNAAGSGLVYSTLIGGANGEEANGIAVDSSGNAYVTGLTISTLGTSSGAKFPTTMGAYTTSSDPGFGDVFVLKLNPTGSDLVYSSVFGGQSNDFGNGIAIDSSGNAYVGGTTQSTGSGGNALFPTSAGSFQQTYGGNSGDGFIFKMNPAGTAFAYSTLLGGSGNDAVNGVDIDSTGRVYATGFSTAFSGNNFPTTAANRYAALDVNSSDAFLSKLSPGGNALEYSTGIGTDGTGGSDGNDSGYAVAVGADGFAYITGGSSRPGQVGAAEFPLKNEYEGPNTQCCFAADLFVAKFDTSAAGGSSLLYSTLIGGSGYETGTAIDVDSAGNAYIGGSTAGATGQFYDTTPDELGTAGTRGSPIITKVVQSGSSPATLGFSTTIPGGISNGITGIQYDEAAGAVYVSGTSTSGSSLSTTTGSFQPTRPGAVDGFVAKISTSAPPPDTTPPVTTLDTGPAANSTVTSSSVTFTFHADEASTFQCAYDGGSFSPCSTPGPGTTGSDTRTLANGLHTFSVRATDSANNVDASPETRTFTVNVTSPPPPPPPAGDTTPPDTTITKAPPKSVKAKRAAVVKVEFVSSDAGSTFSCRVDGDAAASCTSPATFRLGRGKHTISIAATDAAGNKDASPATAEVTVKKKKHKKKK